MKKYRPWTEEEYKLAKDMKKAGASYAFIGETLGRKPQTVHARLVYERKPFHSRKETRMERFSAPLTLVEEQHYRNSLEPRDLTAAICGDPLPGYSALDRR